MRIIFFHNWINTRLSEENEVPRTLFEARKVAYKVKQCETVFMCKVSLFIQFV